MGCVTPSVQGDADKTLAAKEQIDKLQNMLISDAEKNKDYFFNEIETNLKDANITDAIQKGYNMDIKVEYSSEFSLDKIASVVTAALKTLAAVSDPTSPNPTTSPEAIESYTDLVNSVAEAAKSKSTSSSSISFSMNRLCPGMYAFLYATSISIKDDKLFGTEAVTSTAIFYRFMQSADDIKNDASFGETVIDAKNFLAMKALQAGLTDELASGKIDITEWMTKDQAYSAAVDRIEARLKSDGYDTTDKVNKIATTVPVPTAIPAPVTVAADVAVAVAAPVSKYMVISVPDNIQIVTNAIEKLSEMGEKYKPVIEQSKARINSKYY